MLKIQVGILGKNYGLVLLPSRCSRFAQTRKRTSGESGNA